MLLFLVVSDKIFVVQTSIKLSEKNIKKPNWLFEAHHLLIPK